MKVTIAPRCFVDPALESVCCERLAVVLARYADLIGSLAVSPMPTGLRVEVSFDAGQVLTVEQVESGDPQAILHLADRVGRAVARCIDLRADPATSRHFGSSKKPR